ncbi:MAG TPA: efflux RND transporter periplasmic adaptor subunit [Chitinophagaceae bacterium]|nr:efflux RND transporter periplasmic adaptor subunit [Chitinophagaceae bacterium]
MQTNIFQLLIAGLLTIGLSACSSQAAEKKNSASTTVQALPVDIVVAKEVSLQQSETVAGSLVPNRTVDIMSELPKKISSVLFRDGSYVSQGQVLYKLDDADIRARIRQLQADLNLARINETRFGELLKTETVRQEEYDVASTKLQSLKAAQDILHTELSKTFIRAPFSGLIGITKAYTGTLVAPGMPLVTLQEQGTLKVQFTVPEKYLSQVTIGTKIQFSTELTSEKMEAIVVSSEAAVDMLSRNITVQASTANPGNKLKAGMSARVYFNTRAENEKGIMIPTEALIPGGSGYTVFLVKNGKAKITAVTVSNRNEKEALVSSGINNGDTVMISNILRAADGMPVMMAVSK